MFPWSDKTRRQGQAGGRHWKSWRPAEGSRLSQAGSRGGAGFPLPASGARLQFPRPPGRHCTCYWELHSTCMPPVLVALQSGRAWLMGSEAGRRLARAGPPSASSFCLLQPLGLCLHRCPLTYMGSDWSLHCLPWRRGQRRQAWSQCMGHCNWAPLCSHKEQSQAPEPGLKSSTPGPLVAGSSRRRCSGGRVCTQLVQVAVPRGPTPCRLGVRVASFSGKDKSGFCEA